MEEKLSELSIGCPVCNDREHRMTVLVQKSKKKLFISCDKCNALFELVRCAVADVEIEKDASDVAVHFMTCSGQSYKIPKKFQGLI